MLAISRGDMRVLLQLADSYRRKGQLDRTFAEVLAGNLDYAERNNQPVKAKVLAVLRDQISAQPAPAPSPAGAGADVVVDADVSFDWTGQYHAPQFDALPGEAGPSTLDPVAAAVEALAPEGIVSAPGLAAQVLKMVEKSGNKQTQRARKERLRDLGVTVAQSIADRGWVVLDDFIPLEEVRGEHECILHVYTFTRFRSLIVGWRGSRTGDAWVSVRISCPGSPDPRGVGPRE